MILNFYLNPKKNKGEMRPQEKGNLENVRRILADKGVRNADKLDYHEAIQLLAKLVAAEIISKG